MAMKRPAGNAVTSAQYDAWFHQKVAEGVADARAGHVLTGEDVEAEFTERRAATLREIGKRAAPK
jgi:predicted transcriptional regulator